MESEIVGRVKKIEKKNKDLQIFNVASSFILFFNSFMYDSYSRI